MVEIVDRSNIDHLPLFDVAFMFGASSAPDYRARMLMRAQATAEVFSEFGVSKMDLVQRFLEGPETFRVNIGDLTDDGLAFAKVHYQRWLSNSDRWKGDATYEKFKKRLEDHWRKFSENAALLSTSRK